MPADAALSKEEQELFDKMREDDKAVASKPEPEKKAAPEKQAEKAPEKKEQEKGQGSVEAALKEARAQNKELRKEIDGLKGLVAESDKKLAKFVESVSQRAEEAAKPKFEDNPAEHLKHENAQLKKDLEAIKERISKQDAASQQGANLQRHAEAVRAREIAFAKEHPDYDKAAEYVAQVWREEFLEAGFDEDKVPAMVFQKATAMTQQAMAKDKDPAEAIWKIAQRNGYKSQTAETKEDKKSDGETKLQTISKGLEASKTAGGGKGPDELTLASLKDMSDEDIDRIVADPDWWAKNIRRTPLH